MDSHYFHCVQGGNLDPNNMRLLGGQMGSMLQSHLSGSSNALGALGTGLTGSNSARNLSEAMSDPNLTLHGLRSRSPWEGALLLPCCMLAQMLDTKRMISLLRTLRNHIALGNPVFCYALMYWSKRLCACKQAVQLPPSSHRARTAAM